MKLKTLLEGFKLLKAKDAEKKQIYFWDGQKECKIKHLFEFGDRILISTDDFIEIEKEPG